MIVLIDHVGDAVRDAGGWMCDRVWAGWDVTVWVPSGYDTTPLRILGVTVRTLDDDQNLWTGRKPTAVAVGNDLTSLSSATRIKVDALMRDPATEVTLWGDTRTTAGNRFHDLQHRLSRASVMFKTQAMRAASMVEPCASTETFSSCTPRRPLRVG